MIELKNVSKIYHSKKGADCQALHNVSLRFGDNGLVFILGKSGSGKSTLLNVIGGLDKIDDGEITYNGQSFSAFKTNDFDAYRNKVVGFVFQEFNLLEQFNVFDNIELVIKMQRREIASQEIESTLEKVGLKGYGRREISELSGGQKQRVALARALLKQSKIILADEPTGNLDSDASEEIFNLLKEISKDKLVIVVSHDRESAEKYGDGIVEIKDGEIIQNTVNNLDEKQKDNEQINLYRTNIPFVYKLRMVMHNFGKRWFRLSITAVALAISLILVGFTQIMLSVDATESIVRTYTNNKASIVRLGAFSKETDLGNDDFAYVDNGRISAKGLKYLETNEIPFFYYKSNGAYDYISRVFIDSKRSIETLNNFGIKLYNGALSLDENTKYYADYRINEILNNDIYESEWLDGSKNISFEQMAGKTLIYKLYGHTMRYNIAGIFKTGYENYSDFNEKQNGYYHNFWDMCDMRYATIEKIPDIQRQDFLIDNNEGAAITKKETIINVNNKSYTFSKECKDDNIYTQVPNINGCEKIEIYSSEISSGFTEKVLEPNEIAISLTLFKEIFNETIPEYPKSIDYSWQEFQLALAEWNKEVATLADKYKNANIDFELIQSDVDEDLLSLKGKKFIGITTKSESGFSQYSLYVAKGEVENNLSDDFYRYEQCGAIIKVPDYKTFKKILRDLKDDCNTGIYSSYPFYAVDSSIKKTTGIPMLIVAVAAMIMTLLLLMGMVLFGVNSRQREIGIFKALGCRDSDIKVIFLLEVMIIGAIAMALSMAGLYILAYVLNLYQTDIVMLGYNMFFINGITWLIVAIGSFVLTWVVSYLPLIKISKMHPVDAIRK